jgi:hypothetical protein
MSKSNQQKFLKTLFVFSRVVYLKRLGAGKTMLPMAFLITGTDASGIIRQLEARLPDYAVPIAILCLLFVCRPCGYA